MSTPRRYWRVNVTSVNGAIYGAIASLQLRASAGGANLSVTGSGTASAQSIYSASYPAADAFDADTVTTRWASGNGTAFPQWLKWDFGAGLEKDIQHMTIVNSTAETTANIKNAVLQYSDDDTNWYDWIAIVNNSQAAGVTTAYPYVPPGTISIAAAMPLPTTIFNNGDRFIPVLPMPTVGYEAGYTLALALPMPTVLMSTPAQIVTAMPMPTVRISGGPGVLNTIASVLTMPTLAMRAGQTARTVMPMPTVALTGTTTTLIQIRATLPMPTLLMSGTSKGTGSITARMPTAQATARLGNRVSATLPMPTAHAEGRTGSLISITAVMPMALVNCRVSNAGTIQIRATLPMPVVGPWGRLTAVLPMAQVSLVAHSVVTVTYEAYAVNLNPTSTDRDGPVHEVTRYTNWPFNQMLLYQGNWYGVADNGLYLIGGNTDYAAPTPTNVQWDWHTHYTDFGSSQKKAVREVVIGGRLGAATTTKVSIKEETDHTYSYENLRATNAQNHRVKVGKGLKARYWAFGESGTGVGEIDTVDIDATNLERKL